MEQSRMGLLNSFAVVLMPRKGQRQEYFILSISDAACKALGLMFCCRILQKQFCQPSEWTTKLGHVAQK